MIWLRAIAIWRCTVWQPLNGLGHVRALWRDCSQPSDVAPTDALRRASERVQAPNGSAGVFGGYFDNVDLTRAIAGLTSSIFERNPDQVAATVPLVSECIPELFIFHLYHKGSDDVDFLYPREYFCSRSASTAAGATAKLSIAAISRQGMACMSRHCCQRRAVARYSGREANSTPPRSRTCRRPYAPRRRHAISRRRG